MVIILSISFILIFIFNYIYIKNKFYTDIDEDMHHITNDVFEKLADHIESTKDKFFYFVNTKEIDTYYIEERQKDIYNVFDNFKNQFPIVKILNPKTKEVLLNYDNIFLKDREYKVFQEEFNNIDELKKNPNKVLVSKIKYSQKLQKSVIMFSYLKKNYFDEDVAVLYGLFIVDELFHNVNNHYSFRLINSNDLILLSTKYDEINTKKIKTKNLLLNKVDEIIFENEKFFYFIQDSVDGKLLITINKDILLKEIYQHLFLIFLIFVVVFLFSLVILFIYSQKIAKPINILLLQIEEYKKGNFFNKIEIKTNDEIELLSNSFETLGKNLDSNKKELLEINSSLEKRVEHEVQEKLKLSRLAMKAKDQFLASMSHEIRTPLNAILGFIEILKEAETDKEKIKYLEIINKSSNSLLSIINDILDFNKIENQMLVMENIPFSPIEEFQTVKKLFDFKASSNGITLIKKFKDLPNKLLGDALRIKQVLNNLISNAIKFTPKGKTIEIEISYTNEHLYISVKDQGIGISEEYQKRIFIPFTQEDSSTTRKYGGTGLGLSISYKLVSLMGGELKVKSKENLGSEFYCSIPLKETTLNLEEEIIKTQTSFNAHILLAEDNSSNQMFMKILFKKLNLTFDIANDGLEAIDMFKKNQYDLILMDENMPNMSGTEATIQIIKYENERELKHTPIVALTANALKGDRERFLDVGMDNYLSKPLKKEELSRMLEKYLKFS